MIYFDKDKNAYAYKIDNYIATVSEDLWEQVAGDNSAWDIVNGQFIDKRNTSEYKEEKLANAKLIKNRENDIKANKARHNQEFTITLQDKECVFDTKEQTQSDLLTAFAVCSAIGVYTGWVCNNGVVIDLTLEDLVQIQTEFKELSNVYPKWNYYYNLIENAKTVNEVENIVIDY